MIPPDEILVKIGGDKGGSSFMMSLQIVNVMNQTLSITVLSLHYSKDLTLLSIFKLLLTDTVKLYMISKF